MAQWESAVELLQDLKQREAIEKLYVNYVPDEGTINALTEKTGIENEDIRFFRMKDDGEQVLKTEADLDWHLSITNRGQLLTISRNATKSKLILRGRLGWENGVELLQRYGTSCYSNIRLQAGGICLNKERFEDLSEWLKATANGSYWLSDKSIGKQDGELLSIFRVDDGVVGRHIMSWMLECTVHLAMRPGAYLSQDTLLDMGDKFFDGSTPARAIKMRLGGLKEEQSLELERQYYKRTLSHYPCSRSWETIRTKLD